MGKVIIDMPSNKLQEAVELELDQRLGLDHVVAMIAIWGRDRKITTNGIPITQAIKTLEECHELLEAINTNNTDEIIDAIGDIVVTLVMQCELQGLDLFSCVSSAYNEIKDRKGHLNEVGDFIKEK
jgi:hypothetical protein